MYFTILFALVIATVFGLLFSSLRKVGLVAILILAFLSPVALVALIGVGSIGLFFYKTRLT